MWKLQIMEEGDTGWHTLNSSYDQKDLIMKKRLWLQTEYPLADYRIVRERGLVKW